MTREDRIFDDFIKIMGAVAGDEAMAQLRRRKIFEVMFAQKRGIETEMEEQAMKLRVHNLEWRGGDVLVEFITLAKWTDEGLIYAAKKNGKELMEGKSE